ncbi:putative transmembrane protein [Senna tora]|uniref:Putative transmembrane protein n=1 Tax=Senna tora TaxID=362788 RepID=A0A834WQ11_9FABA|nr:putative transmembrane protein [Senna tora]
MVQRMRASLTCFILFLFVLASLVSVHYSTHTQIPEVVNEGNQHRVSHQRWQRKSWMNHGSSRGTRKHLVNPTIEHPFQAREFPV